MGFIWHHMPLSSNPSIPSDVIPPPGRGRAPRTRCWASGCSCPISTRPTRTRSKTLSPTHALSWLPGAGCQASSMRFPMSSRCFLYFRPHSIKIHYSCLNMLGMILFRNTESLPCPPRNGAQNLNGAGAKVDSFLYSCFLK